MKLGIALALWSLPAALAAAAYADSNAMLPRDADNKPTKHHTDGASASSSSAASSSSSSSASHSKGKSIVSSSSAANPSVTEVGVFTAGGVPYTVTSFHSSELIDGKTLSAGGPGQIIAGALVSEASNGNVIVNGNRVKFHPYTPSTSSSFSPGPSVGPSASSSGSSSGSAPPASTSGTTSSGNGAAVPTRAVGAGAAFVGAVVGALVL